MSAPRRIVVVGAGLEAWLAASMLEGILNEPGRRLVEVAVVESDTPAMAPAETSRPGLVRALAVAGIDPVECVRRTGSTFCQALRFRGWQRGGSSFYHPFQRHRTLPLDTSATAWLRSDLSIPFAETVSPQPALCDAGIGPLPLPGRAGIRLDHGFHVDTAKLAALLRETAAARGVVRKNGTVTDIDRHDDGSIAAVGTQDGQRIEGDLFVDATGPGATLIGELLGVPWIDCSDLLPCDAELSVDVGYEAGYPGSVRPYTRVTAATGGWIRDLPLQDRRVLGYLHARAHLSEDQALRELSSLDIEIDESTVRLRDFAVGYRVRAWAGNCVAVGAAAAAVEPLEATTLYLAEFAAFLLAEHFPLSGDPAPLAWRYNRIFADRFQEIADFVNLHYRLAAAGEGAFWQAVQAPGRRRERVAAKLDFWQVRPPSFSDFEDAAFAGEPDTPLPASGYPGDDRPPRDTGGLFGLAAWEAVLYGAGALDAACDRWYGTDRPPARVLPEVARQIDAAMSTLLPQDAWLRQVCGMPDYDR